MVTVKFIEHGVGQRVVRVPAGISLMEAAVQNGVNGIEATCGGACSCATCHVYVDPAWSVRLFAPNDAEVVMLELVDHPTTESRLSCQIKLVPALDGLIVQLPASQRS